MPSRNATVATLFGARSCALVGAIQYCDASGGSRGWLVDFRPAGFAGFTGLAGFKGFAGFTGFAGFCARGDGAASNTAASVVAEATALFMSGTAVWGLR